MSSTGVLQTGLLRKRLRQRLEQRGDLGECSWEEGATPVGEQKDSTWAYREAGLGCVCGEALALRGPPNGACCACRQCHTCLPVSGNGMPRWGAWPRERWLPQGRLTARALHLTWTLQQLGNRFFNPGRGHLGNTAATGGQVQVTTTSPAVGKPSLVLKGSPQRPQLPHPPPPGSWI